jgi:hypothetical protein
MFLYRVVVMYLTALLGFCFYITFWPEAHFPGACTTSHLSHLAGKFDIFGHSHQWWHVFTLASYVWLVCLHNAPLISGGSMLVLSCGSTERQCLAGLFRLICCLSHANLLSPPGTSAHIAALAS